jgi:hypothetical protein
MLSCVQVRMPSGMQGWKGNVKEGATIMQLHHKRLTSNTIIIIIIISSSSSSC